ncbi:MAG: hypothetical protein ACTSQU_13365 [Promethearchaeota archaeon]
MKLLNDSVDEINGSNLVHKFVFINIAQDPSNHYFCSKKCKNDWIFKSSKSER